jgi:hypothetical protein
MTTIKTSSRQDTLLGVARDYIADGYSVTLYPETEELPVFLREWDIEMVVTRQGIHAVVIVCAPEAVRNPRWLELNRLLRAHGWELDFAVRDGAEPIASRLDFREAA